MQIPVFTNESVSKLHGIQDEGLEGHFRVEAVNNALRAFVNTDFIPSREVTEDELILVHTKEHKDLIIRATINAPLEGIIIGEQMRVYRESWKACATMAGGVVQAVDEMVSNAIPYAWVTGRSPGHHAENMSPMGYCLLSNVAIAAKVANAKFGFRVAILDFDVHEGNGTKKVLTGQSEFLVIDVFIEGHNQYPYIPNNRKYRSHNIIEIPLPPGIACRSYLKELANNALPQISLFNPDLIICSAGFDCMTGDPFGGFKLSALDMSKITKAILSLDIPTLFVLEGGYNLPNLESGVTKVTEEINNKLSVNKINPLNPN